MPAEALEAWQRPLPGGLQQRHIDEGLVLFGNKARVRRLVQVSMHQCRACPRCAACRLVERHIRRSCEA